MNYDSIEMVSAFNQFPNILSIHFAENALPVAGIRSRAVRTKIAFQVLLILAFISYFILF